MSLEKLKRAVIKEELVALTGDLEKAIMLNQFIYWSERIKDFDNFIIEEKERMKKSKISDDNLDFQNGWIYKDMEDLKEEVMMTSSISTMSRKLKELVDAGYLSRRNNPKHRWDKRYQYRVNLIDISEDLFNLGYVLQGYKVNVVQFLETPNLQNETSNLQNETSNLQNETSNLQNDSSNLQNDSSNLQNDKAISETTTETTSKTTSKTTTEKKSGGIKITKEEKKETTTTALTKKDIDLVIKEWNQLGLQNLKAINSNTKRHTMLKARIDEYSLDEVIQAIQSISKSSFLKGQNQRNWVITFDWLVKPNNFLKVIEGNYLDKEGNKANYGTKNNKVSKYFKPHSEERLIEERLKKIEGDSGRHSEGELTMEEKLIQERLQR